MSDVPPSQGWENQPGGQPPPPPPQQGGYPPPGGYQQQPGYGQPAHQQPAGGQWQGPPLAEWPQRAVGYLIDYVAPFLAVAIVGMILGVISDVLGTLVFVLGYIAAFVFVIWNLIQQGNTGQTIGKKQMGLRLVLLETGQPVGAGLSIGRYFIHVAFGFLCGIGTLADLLWPLWDPMKQTLADKLVKTVVVKV